MKRKDLFAFSRKKTIQLDLKTSLWYKMVKIPGPALAHSRASVLIVSNSEVTEGRALSKTAAFRCFQIHHAVSIIIDEMPLRSWRGVVCITSDHQSAHLS